MTIEEYISDLRYYNETGLGAISSYEAGEIADALEGLLFLSLEEAEKALEGMK